MGNTESSSQFPARPPPSSRGRNVSESESESSLEKALKVGAAVAGGALLALGAYSLAAASSSSSSNSNSDSDDRKTANHHTDHTTVSVRTLEGFNYGTSSHLPQYPTHHLGFVDPNSNQNLLKIMSYNVWFREDLELNNRMEAIGDLIQQHSPDIICLQEVTPEIYDIFKKSTWWRAYKCSLSQEIASHRAYFCMQMSKLPANFTCKPFDNTIMGRELCLADVNIGADEKLVIATSHLESPCPGPPRWDQMFSKERVAQAKMSVDLLKSYPNVILCGDMNWDDKLDGAFPLDDGWVDAWMQLKSGEDGWTYDTKANKMLSGNRKLQKRLDRFLCKLRDFKIDSIDMIGMEVIPGLSHRKKVGKAGKELVLPVLPSDHFGLLLTIRRI